MLTRNLTEKPLFLSCSNRFFLVLFIFILMFCFTNICGFGRRNSAALRIARKFLVNGSKGVSRCFCSQQPPKLLQESCIGKESTCCCQSEYFHNPDSPSVYVHTFGCSHNMSDGEYMKGLLAAGGYNITNVKEEADVW